MTDDPGLTTAEQEARLQEARATMIGWAPLGAEPLLLALIAKDVAELEAAARAEAEAQVEALREALEPFAQLGLLNSIFGNEPDDVIEVPMQVLTTAYDAFALGEAALAATEGEARP